MITKTNQTSISWIESSGIGLTVGSADVFVNHSLWALTARIQAKLTFTLNPLILYKGFFVHLISSAPLDALQVTMSHLIIQKVLPNRLDETIKRIAGGFFGGCSAALISCPAEMLMVWQQKNMGFKQALKAVCKESPLHLYTGFTPMVIREGLFCAGFFSFVPYFRGLFQSRGIKKTEATLLAGILSGAITAIISQPFDTVKTVIQASEKKTQLRQVVKHLIKEDGVKGLFKGLSYRTTRVISTIVILGSLNIYLEEKLYEYKESQK